MGDKNADSVRGLPEWIDDAPRVVQMELALLFVRGRATTIRGRRPGACRPIGGGSTSPTGRA